MTKNDINTVQSEKCQNHATLIAIVTDLICQIRNQLASRIELKNTPNFKQPPE